MLLKNTPSGLFCEAGGFYVDPWRPVDLAIITHAHSDHARPGSRAYLTESRGKAVLQQRLEPGAPIETLKYGETTFRNGVKVSLHPAGHILGSSQVRIEHAGEICVVSGDYKVESDGLCAPFELVKCHTFVTESTFGLPIFRWQPQAEIFSGINEWWQENQTQGRTSVVFCYALGKAQRVLKGLNAARGPIFLHGAAERFVVAYEQAGVKFPSWSKPEPDAVKEAAGRGLVLAPTSADNTPWLRRFGDVSTAFASGWMLIRGTRRRRSLDRGFVLSDHADWSGLLETVRATGAENVWVTHGYTAQLVRWLREHGLNAEEIATEFSGETEEESRETKSDAPPAEDSSAE